MATDSSTSIQAFFPEDWTVANLLDELDVPPERIRLRPAPGTATEADVEAIADREGRLFEVIDGTLVEKAMGAYEGELAGIILYYIHSYLTDHRIGHAFPADVAMRILSRQVRIPDVSFVSNSRRGKAKLAPIPELVPNLAVEVLSEGNTKREMDRKLREYFEAGVELVWYIDPKSRTARVFTSTSDETLVDQNGTLDGGNVLPGLSISLAEAFARVDDV